MRPSLSQDAVDRGLGNAGIIPRFKSGIPNPQSKIRDPQQGFPHWVLESGLL
jgi:hypothetical protein